MPKKTLFIDSQILSTIMLCPKMTELRFVRNLGTEQKPEPFERGDLLHKVFAKYYTEIKEGVSRPFASSHALQFGREFAIQSQLDDIDVNDILYQCSEYFLYYHDESWHPIAVEQPFSFVLYEDDDLKIIYGGIIDLVVELENDPIMPVDHKSQKKRYDISDLSNQFMGYCTALGVNNININKVGFQKTLKPNERFTRQRMSYSDERLHEWKIKVAVPWARQLIFHEETGMWPMNWTSCDKYSGCFYKNYICRASPDVREYNIERHFVIQEPWNPTAPLEKGDSE